MNKITIFTLNKPNIKDFSYERNLLLKKSKTDWVFFLDSDEKLMGGKLDINSDQFNAYTITRKNYFLGDYVGKNNLVRLVKKGTGTWTRMVHEYWEGGSVGKIKSTYIIHSTAKDLRSYIDKMNYYSDLHAKANFIEGKRSSLLKIIALPIAKFFTVFIQSGNVVFSIMQSLHSFLAWTKLFLYY